jgi:tRNA threonylcarbamoyladenosine modification (KEOPS) complex Cgi121 subunit
MLYASGQRQIRKAMKLIGIKSNTQEIAVLVIGEDAEKVNSAFTHIGNFANAKRDDGVLDLTEDKIEVIQKAFKISNEEIEAVMKNGDLKEAVKKLIIERVALLSTRR